LNLPVRFDAAFLFFLSILMKNTLVVTNKRKLFPTDDAAKKVIYLAIQQASKNGLCRLGIGKWP